ncbi:ATP-binding cassette domain-containing protein, partial [Rhizobium alarense]|uniref:ATP-binding cassette domain-containing protein n=1 Tax=Rhizobium alarense TaxID=2846851 RepID=UPI002E32B9AB
MSVSMPTTVPLMQARALTKNFVVGKTIRPGSGQVLHAVDAVSLEVRPAETLGLVGESGSGKSTLGRCLTRFYDITSGTLAFDGADITRAGSAELKPVRRNM